MMRGCGKWHMQAHDCLVAIDWSGSSRACSQRSITPVPLPPVGSASRARASRGRGSFRHGPTGTAEDPTTPSAGRRLDGLVSHPPIHFSLRSEPRGRRRRLGDTRANIRATCEPPTVVAIKSQGTFRTGLAGLRFGKSKVTAMCADPTPYRPIIRVSCRPHYVVGYLAKAR